MASVAALLNLFRKPKQEVPDIPEPIPRAINRQPNPKWLAWYSVKFNVDIATTALAAFRILEMPLMHPAYFDDPEQWIAFHNTVYRQRPTVEILSTMRANREKALAQPEPCMLNNEKTSVRGEWIVWHSRLNGCSEARSFLIAAKTLAARGLVVASVEVEM